MESSSNPQNPYHSFIVSASAGSGKTYQLSRRFLYLVAAGAQADSILTLTFTKKAAAEMKERILMEAAGLLNDNAKMEEFAKFSRYFYNQLVESSREPSQFMPPHSPEKTASLILGSSQSLKISTIDSIFFEWIKRFSWEARDSRSKRATELPRNPKILSLSDSAKIDLDAWQRASLKVITNKNFNNLNKIFSRITLMDLENRILELSRNRNYLWLVAHSRSERGGEASPFNPHKLPLTPSAQQDFPQTESQLIEYLKAPLLQIAEALSKDKRDDVIAAIFASDLCRLIELKVLKKDYAVSGSFIRGKKREQFATQINSIDSTVKLFRNQIMLDNLNQEGSFIIDLFKTFDDIRDRLKYKNNFMEFDDASKGCYHLFHNDVAAGARFLLHKKTSHLMLDEFQDTNPLQWSIFYAMINEMIAGIGIDCNGGPKQSIFIVGDPKQSIYGFREADPKILSDAVESLCDKGVNEVKLNQSYRTSQTILDFVNCHFSEKIVGFARHQTATIGTKEVVPNHGMVTISDLITDDPHDPDQISCYDKEAKFVADFLHDATAGKNPLPVFDKSNNAFRAIRPSDCVVLYRAATHADVFEKALKKSGFKVKKEGQNDFFARSEICDLVSLIKFLAYPCDLMSLIIVLKSPLGNIPDKKLLSLVSESNKKEKTDQRRVEFILQELKQEYPQVILSIDALLNQRLKRSFYEVLIEGITLFEAFKAYTNGYSETEGMLARSNIIKLLEVCQNLETKGFLSAPTILRQLELLRENQEIAATGFSDADAINLMTIHKAKGLEFPLVVLVDTGSSWEKRDLYWAKGVHQQFGTGMYYVGTSKDRPREDRCFDGILQTIDDEIYTENLRLLYVAITRAKEYLLISGCRGSSAKKKPGFHNDLWQSGLRLEMQKKVFCGQRILCLDNRVYPKKLPIFTDNAPISVDRLPPFSGKIPTSTHQEISCLAPNRLLRIPEDSLPFDSAAEFKVQLGIARGSFIHKGLECAAIGQPFASENQWSRLIDLNNATLPQTLNEQAYHEAKRALDCVISSKVWQTLIASALKIETEVEIVHLNGHNLVMGTIDLLVTTATNRILVIDYKTTPIEKSHQNESYLRELCIKKKYNKQLKLYVGAIQKVEEGKEIVGALYFTAINKLIIFDDSAILPNSPIKPELLSSLN